MNTLKRFGLCILALVAAPAFATVDYDDEITIVSESAEGELILRKVPFIGCMGIPTYETVTMFTFDHKIPLGGCGNKYQLVSANYLSCAKLAIEDNDAGEISKVTVNLDGCEAKLKAATEYDAGHVSQVARLARQALDRNFGAKLKSVIVNYKGKAIDTSKPRSPASFRLTR